MSVKLWNVIHLDIVSDAVSEAIESDLSIQLSKEKGLTCDVQQVYNHYTLLSRGRPHYGI